MMADSELPPQVILSHDETLHQIFLPPLATFLAGLTEARHLLRLHEILEQYRTPTSYHRIDVREVSSSELPFLDLQDEAAQGDDKINDRDFQSGGAGNTSLADVARIRGDPIILDAGATLDAQLGTVASNDGVDGPDHTFKHSEIVYAVVSSGNTAPFEPGSFHASAVPVKDPPRETRATSGASDVITPLPPSGPRRRVRELRLDLRTLDAAALFTLETWRRQELGLDKLDMRVPDSVWYQDDREPTPEASDPSKRKRGRPRKVAENQAVPDVTLDSTGSEMPDIPAPAIEQGPADDTERVDASQREDAAGESHLSANAEAGPSVESRYRHSPSPEELLPDAYNEADEQDSDFVPEDEERVEREAEVALGTDGQPKKRRGRPLKQSVPVDQATATAPGRQGPGRPRKSTAGDMTDSPSQARTQAGMKGSNGTGSSPLDTIAPVPQLSASAAPGSAATVVPNGTGPLPTPQSAERARTRVSSIAQTPPATSMASSARSSRRSSVAVEIRTKRLTVPQKRKVTSEDEDEDWGFLKAFT